MHAGEEKGWDVLAGLDPEKVCQEALVTCNRNNGIYTLKSFGMDLCISPKEKNILSNAPDSDMLLNDLNLYSILSFLWYLANAKGIPFSGKLVRPENLKGGGLFSKGTHVLPLERISKKYNKNIEGFHLRGRELCCEQLEYGDASIKLLPLPRIPVTLIFWKGDKEFPPRTDLLFDSTSEFQVPIDILWSIAMMSVLIML